MYIYRERGGEVQGKTSKKGKTEEQRNSPSSGPYALMHRKLSCFLVFMHDAYDKLLLCTVHMVQMKGYEGVPQLFFFFFRFSLRPPYIYTHTQHSVRESLI